MPEKPQYKTVRVDVETAAMLKILKGRAFAAGEHVTYNGLVLYMIESQYPDVYKKVMSDESDKA